MKKVSSEAVVKDKENAVILCFGVFQRFIDHELGIVFTEKYSKIYRMIEIA